MSEDIDKMNKYLDGIAEFLCKHVPDYKELPSDSLAALEHIWLALANNRLEFISVLDNVKRTRNRVNK
jgi:hypothetical protein